jgi:hypothetical protein
VGEHLAAEALGEQREPACVVAADRLDELGLIGADRTRRSVFGRLHGVSYDRKAVFPISTAEPARTNRSKRSASRNGA